jgi:hypothetical protein
MSIPNGTYVIWEESDPRGPCYNNVLHEGRVIDNGYFVPTHHTLVTDSPNAIPDWKQCRYIPTHKLVW